MRFVSLLIACSGLSLEGTGDDTSSVNDDHAGDTMEEEVCAPIETPMTADEVTPLGFSVADAIDWVTSTWTGTMAHADGDTTLGVVQTEWTGGPLVMVTHDDPSGGIEIFCADHLRIGVPLTLSTADGAFVFTLSADAKVIAAEEWTVEAETTATGNLGAHESGGDRYAITRAVSGDEESGDVAVITEGSDGDAVWISQQVVLSWPEVP